MLNANYFTFGNYTYFGIKSGLIYIIDHVVYTENEIQLEINSDDGADFVNKTKNHAWPVLGCVNNCKYKSKPFIIAIYYGPSKPISV